MSRNHLLPNRLTNKIKEDDMVEFKVMSRNHLLPNRLTNT